MPSKKVYFGIFVALIFGLMIVSFGAIFIHQKYPSVDTKGIQFVKNANNLASTSIKRVALTFDDGPYGTSTQKILDILKSEKVHATFFLVGKNVDKFPDIAREIVANGNLIGNHSYDHSKYLAFMSTSTFEQNLQNGEQAILKQTGLKPKFFRPPYGNISPTMQDTLVEQGYTNVMWDIDPRDWDFYNSPAKNIVKKVLSDTKPNFIIIMHDGRDVQIDYPRDNTIKALPEIIEGLKKQGFEFVTVDKILGTQPYWENTAK